MLKSRKQHQAVISICLTLLMMFSFLNTIAWAEESVMNGTEQVIDQSDQQQDDQDQNSDQSQHGEQDSDTTGTSSLEQDNISTDSSQDSDQSQGTQAEQNPDTGGTTSDVQDSTSTDSHQSSDENLAEEKGSGDTSVTSNSGPMGLMSESPSAALAPSDPIQVAGSASDSTISMADGGSEISSDDNTWEIALSIGTLNSSSGDDISLVLTVNGLPADLKWTAVNGGSNNIIITVSGSAASSISDEIAVSVAVSSSAVSENGTIDSEGIIVYIKPASVPMFKVLLSAPPTVVYDWQPIGDFNYDLYSDGTAKVVRYTGPTGSNQAIVIPETVTYLADNYTVTAIDLSVFYETAMKSVSIPTGVTSIPIFGFARSGVKNVFFAESGSLVSIDTRAFAECTNLSSINIPCSVTSIGENAFNSCSSLSRAYFWGAKPTFGSGVFTGADGDFILYYHVRNAASWSGYSDYTARAFCNLTLDLQDGSSPASSYVDVDSSGHIAASADPTSSLGSFAGWYKDAACSTAFDLSSDTVSDDITLYAKWNSGNVCQIGTTGYTTLDAALAAVKTGETITLLADIDYSSGITISGKNITIDLNGYALDVTNTNGAGLEVLYGSVTITGSGAFNVTGTTFGVTAHDDASVSITGNVTAVGSSGGVSGAGADASQNSTVTITGNVQGVMRGAGAFDATSSVTITGDVTATNVGVSVSDGGKATINGKVQAVGIGIDAWDISTVQVTGNVSASGSDGNGVFATNGASVTITGNVEAGRQGVYAKGSSGTMFSFIKVTGDVATSDATKGFAACATDGASVEVGGKAQSGFIGADAESGGSITITGDLIAKSGAFATGTNSKIEVGGGITASDSNGSGAWAEKGAAIKVSGDLHGGIYGAHAIGDKSRIEVGGNATATNGTGAYAESGGTVDIDGDVQGTDNGACALYSSTSIIVGGNATATGAAGRGVFAAGGASINVTGYIQGAYNGATAQGADSSVFVGGTVYSGQYGVIANNGGELTIDGAISVGSGSAMAIGPGSYDHIIPSTKTGYEMYSDGTSTVWVKSTSPVAEPTITLTTTKAAGENVWISIGADPADLASVWIDLNGNNTKDAGEDVVGLNKKYTVFSQNITIHGKVTKLGCPRCNLSSLDLSNTSYLLTLDCNDNQLTMLDVSHNTALQTLTCRNNLLTSLGLSQNTMLDKLDAYNNKLALLDFSKNTLLTYLNCEKNQLTSLDVSKNILLTYLNCSSNQLSGLDVTQNTQITKLLCALNQLTALEVSSCTGMTWLTCSNNAIGSLDLSNNTALTDLYCNNNQLVSLDLSGNTLLTRIDCYSNRLATINVLQNTVLYWLDCSDNRLTSLDISKNAALKVLKVYCNDMNGAKMTDLITGLLGRAAADHAKIYIIDTKATPVDGNVALKSDVAIGISKNWTVYDWNKGNEVLYAGSDPISTPTDAVTFVLSNEDGGLIDDLITDGYGDRNLYEALQILKPQSNGVITDEFISKLAACPADSEVLTCKLKDCALPVNNPIGINSNGTLCVLGVFGLNYCGKDGYMTYPANPVGENPKLFTYATSPQYYIDGGSDGTTHSSIFAIAWSPHTSQSFILSNENGEDFSGGLIDKLVTAGYGDKNLYEVLQILKPQSNGVISDEFMTKLAACPAGSDIFTAALRNFANGSNNPIGINSDGTLIVAGIYGSYYDGIEGYTTTKSQYADIGKVLITKANSPEYNVIAGTRTRNEETTFYQAFAIAWVSEEKTPSTSSGGGSDGGSNTPTVTTSSASISEQSALLNGSISARGSAAVSEYGFAYSTDQQNWTEVAVGSDNFLGSFNYTLEGLTSNTEYYFKAYATNSSGRGYGSVKSFLVLEEQNVQTPATPLVLRFYVGKYEYYVNDQERTMDTVAIIVQERTLLPIRYVAENLGAIVSWDAEQQKATITFNDKTIELWIGQGMAMINGVSLPIDPDNPAVTPIIQEPGRAMLPLRFISESLGCTVDWNPDMQEVMVTYP